MGKAVLLVALFALIIYGLLRLWERRQASKRPAPSTQFPTPPTRRVVAPDDDADFLRDLERKRRKDQKSQPDDETRPDSDG